MELNEKHSELSLQESGLNESRDLLIKEILIEEKPFEGTKWELFLGPMNNNIYLQYLEGNKDKIEEIHQLCFTFWHASFEIQNGIFLRFNDGDYSLTATEFRQLINFAKKQNLTIVAADIEDKVRKLSRQLASLQEICHQFNLKI